jgi:hypothetical protein
VSIERLLVVYFSPRNKQARKSHFADSNTPSSVFDDGGGDDGGKEPLQSCDFVSFRACVNLSDLSDFV